jgi:hypothetical protein
MKRRLRPTRALIPVSRIPAPAVLDDTLTEADIVSGNGRTEANFNQILQGWRSRSYTLIIQDLHSR